MQRNYYDILGIPSDTSSYDIFMMYCKWLKSEDRDNAELKEVYRVLTNESLREKYDKAIGIPEKTVPISWLSKEIEKSKKQEKETHDNYTTALFWVVACAPILGSVLFPEYFVQGVNFPKSILVYALFSVVSFIVAGAYMVLVAVCSHIGSEKNKHLSIVVLFAVCAFLFCVFQAWR